MGLMDSLKEALGGDRDDAREARVQPMLANARHVDREAPPERMEDATLVTGGKHKAIAG